MALPFSITFTIPTAPTAFAGTSFDVACRALPSLFTLTVAIVAVSLIIAIIGARSTRAVRQRLAPRLAETLTHTIVACTVAATIFGARFFGTVRRKGSTPALVTHTCAIVTLAVSRAVVVTLQGVAISTSPVAFTTTNTVLALSMSSRVKAIVRAGIVMCAVTAIIARSTLAGNIIDAFALRERTIGWAQLQ